MSKRSVSWVEAIFPKQKRLMNKDNNVKDWFVFPRNGDFVIT